MRSSGRLAQERVKMAKAEHFVGMLAAATLVTSLPVVAQAKEQFWVAREIRQGMTLAEFTSYVAVQNLTVSYPLKDGLTKSVTIDGQAYWLMFCNDRLSYASFLINSNEDFIKSVDSRVNGQGFKQTRFSVSNRYSDTTNTQLPELQFRLEKPVAAYSITYFLYKGNGQVALEDERYDDSYGCKAEPIR